MPTEPSLDRRMSDLALAIDNLSDQSNLQKHLPKIIEAVNNLADQVNILHEIGDHMRNALERIAKAPEERRDNFVAEQIKSLRIAVDELTGVITRGLQNDKFRPATEEWRPRQILPDAGRSTQSVPPGKADVAQGVVKSPGLERGSRPGKKKKRRRDSLFS